jgi:hypothetical protein
VTHGTLGSPLRGFVARAGRLARERSPAEIAETVVRASRRTLASRRVELGLKRAARRGTPVVLGPFLGEVGFELLYWIPMARRLMTQHGIEAERVIAFTRGGAGQWYEDFARHSLDLYTLVEPVDFRRQLAERRAHAGDDKMLSVETQDRRLMDAARARFGDVAIVHPILMYSRLRWIWQGERAPETIHEHADYRLLQTPEQTLELPDDFVAVKAYFNDCFPENEANRGVLERLLERLAASTDVVLLSADAPLDDHEDWTGPGDHPRITRLLPDPLHNLATQAAAVARARALISIYGGFSYLGAFLGVPTIAIRSQTPSNPRHLDVLRMALPGADFIVLDSDRIDEIDRLLVPQPA